MTTFVDTSALIAIVNPAESAHVPVSEKWIQLHEDGEHLRTHSYVVIESTAVIQHRHGMEAVRLLHDELLPAVSIRFVDELLHERAVAALLAADRRQVSLVDWTSFELMRDENITDALALDDDFSAQGFTPIP